MTELGAKSLSEVALFIPGLRIQEQSHNNPGFVIRGITLDSSSAQQGARVSLYYNGVDISRTRGAYRDLYDLERIEVVPMADPPGISNSRRTRVGRSV